MARLGRERVAPATSQRKKRRIAVIGLDDVEASSEQWLVNCFGWSYSGETSVVADYDVAIVNLLETAPQEKFISRGLPPLVDGDIVLGLLQGAAQLLLGGGEIVVLGHPDVHVKSRSGMGYNWVWSSMPYWTGMSFQWDERAGDHVEIVSQGDQSKSFTTSDGSSRFLSYLRLIDGYKYSLLRADPDTNFLRHVVATSSSALVDRARAGLSVKTLPLAKTRRGGAVASEHLIEIASTSAQSAHDGEWTKRHSGRVIILPEVGMPARETVAFILRETYNVHIKASAPDWLNELVAPGERQLLVQSRALHATLAKITSEIAEVDAMRSRVRQALGLLAMCDRPLEVGVRELLRQLGASVEDPEEPNKEDGWVEVTIDGRTFVGVLEVKGTQRATFDEKGLRQLVEWVTRANRSRGRLHKGIFIGNSAYSVPPSQRVDPFSSSFRASAKASGFVALTVEALLREAGRIVDDGAAPTEFWRGVFATTGVFE